MAKRQELPERIAASVGVDEELRRSLSKNSIKDITIKQQ
jgi:hypothetical protein